MQDYLNSKLSDFRAKSKRWKQTVALTVSILVTLALILLWRSDFLAPATPASDLTEDSTLSPFEIIAEGSSKFFESFSSSIGEITNELSSDEEEISASADVSSPIN